MHYYCCSYILTAMLKIEMHMKQFQTIIKRVGRSSQNNGVGGTLFGVILIVMSLYFGLYAVPNVQSAMQGQEPITKENPLSINSNTDIKKSQIPKPAAYSRATRKHQVYGNIKMGSENSIKIAAKDSTASNRNELGLRLVGTVVFDKSEMNQALFESLSTHKQGIFREGSRIGNFRIKEILRNKVIIATEEGERLLEVGHGRSSSLPSPPDRGAAKRRTPAKSYSLSHEQVAASLENIDDLEQQLDITPNLIDDYPVGFVISRIPRQSILRKMGLKNNNAIIGVNGQAITGPEQADLFFQTLKQGGEVDVKVKKGRGVRRRTRTIHLNIN